MPILFIKTQKAQNGMLTAGTTTPVEGQMSGSGRVKYTNGKWVATPTENRTDIKDVYGIASLTSPNYPSVETFDINKKKEQVTQPLIGNPKSNYEAIVQSNVPYNVGDTLYNPGLNRIPYQGGKKYFINANTQDKGTILGSIHFKGKNP